MNRRHELLNNALVLSMCVYPIKDSKAGHLVIEKDS